MTDGEGDRMVRRARAYYEEWNPDCLGAPWPEVPGRRRETVLDRAQARANVDRLVTEMSARFKLRERRAR